MRKQIERRNISVVPKCSERPLHAQVNGSRWQRKEGARSVLPNPTFILIEAVGAASLVVEESRKSSCRATFLPPAEKAAATSKKRLQDATIVRQRESTANKQSGSG